MLPQPPCCPECGSKEVDFVPRRGGYLCANNHFFPDASCRTGPLRIFLSYAHDDRAFLARETKRRLEALGHEVWFDEERLKCGQDWEQGIDQGLQWVSEAGTAARFVLFMTPHAVRRPDGFCLNELARASQRQIPVFPVLVEACEPPLSICRTQWLDLRYSYSGTETTAGFEKQIERLNDGLATGRWDFEGELLDLRRVLSPLSFEVDTSLHLRRFTGREWIIKSVDRWLEDEAGTKILWITGGPGSGKTALASYLQFYHPAVKAFFLCKAPSSPHPQGRYEPGDPRWCVRTLAYQLAALSPDYRARLTERGNLEQIVAECSAEDLFEKLITESMSTLPPSAEGARGRAVALIDGLDEVTADGVNPLSSFLVSHALKTPAWLRFIVLSRDEDPLTAEFQRYRPVPLDGDPNFYESDLRAFIAREFARFAPDGVVAEATMRQILEKSEGNFLYVEQVREALERGILRYDEAGAFPRGLGELFYQWLRRRFPDLAEYRHKYFTAVSVLCAAGAALSLEEAEILFDWKHGFEYLEFRERFGALFRCLNDQIVPFHKSLVDWLASESAGGYRVNLELGHGILAENGYAAFQKSRSGAPLDAVERRRLRDLPGHLLALQRNRRTALDRLLEFLTAAQVFHDCFREDLHGYIAYWNSLTRALPERRLLLGDSVKRLEQSLAEGGEELRDWETYQALGTLCFEIGEQEEAAGLLETAAARLPADCSPASAAALYNSLGEVYCHDSSVRDLKKAEINYARALEIRRKICPTDHRDLGESINNMGHVYYYQQDCAKAIAFYAEALEMWRRMPCGPYYDEADSLNNLAVCHDGQGLVDQAEKEYELAVQVMAQLKTKHWGFLVIYANYGAFLVKRGKLDKALEQYSTAYALALELYGPDSRRSMKCAADLAGRFFAQGRVREGVGICRELIEAYDRTHGQQAHPGAIHDICLLLEGLATVEADPDVMEIAQQIVSRLDSATTGNPEVRSRALHDAGAVLFLGHDFATAEKYLAEALALREKIYPPGHSFTAQTLQILAGALNAMDRGSEATDRIAEFYHAQILNAPDNNAALDAMERHARFLRDAGRWAGAELAYRAMITRFEPMLAQTDLNADEQTNCRWGCAIAYNEIAHYGYMPSGDYALAAEHYGRSVQLMQGHPNEGELRNMRLNYAIARSRELSGQPGKESELSGFLEEVRRLTAEMEANGDARAAKGTKLLTDLTGEEKAKN